LLKEGNDVSEENEAKSAECIINNVRNYGVSIINYAVKDIEYLGYKVVGIDKHWEAKRNHYPDISLLVDNYGVINVMVGTAKLRFVVTCCLPYESGNQSLPQNTYIIAYDNNDDKDEYAKSSMNSTNILPVSLKDITCVERIAIILRKEILKQYVEHTLFKTYDIPLILRPYYDLIATFITCIKINVKAQSYIFTKYPTVEFNKNAWRDNVLNSDDYKNKNRMEQKKISDALNAFMNEYELSAKNLRNELRCFDPHCSLPINSWQCDSLKYITCSCGYVLDSSNPNRIVFSKKDAPYTPNEFGMDYLEISYELGEKL
jgi:hypothetical protein